MRASAAAPASCGVESAQKSTKQLISKVGVDVKSWAGKSASEELKMCNISVSGRPPEWLSGSLLWVGPAGFQHGEDAVGAWIDRDSMLYHLQI